MNAVLLPSRRPISVDEFHRMDQAGIFGPKERVELLDGEIFVMPAIGSKHSGVVNRLDRLLRQVVLYLRSPSLRSLV